MYFFFIMLILLKQRYVTIPLITDMETDALHPGGYPPQDPPVAFQGKTFS
jgi:hypothetical protein